MAHDGVAYGYCTHNVEALTQAGALPHSAGLGWIISPLTPKVILRLFPRPQYYCYLTQFILDPTWETNFSSPAYWPCLEFVLLSKFCMGVGMSTGDRYLY